MKSLTYKFQCPKCEQRIEADQDLSLNFIQCPGCKTDIIAPPVQNSDFITNYVASQIDRFDYNYIYSQIIYCLEHLFWEFNGKNLSALVTSELILLSGWTVQMAVRVAKPNSDIESVAKKAFVLTYGYLDYRLKNYHEVSVEQLYSVDSRTVTATKFYSYDLILLSTNDVEDEFVFTLLVNSLFNAINMPSNNNEIYLVRTGYKFLVNDIKSDIARR